MSAKRIAASFVTALALPAQEALACSVCFSGRDETRIAYLLTTLFMTAPPLIAVGAGIWWVRKKALSAERGRSASSQG